MPGITSQFHSGMEALPHPKVRTLAIGLIGFLTLVDLFAAQAILPQLAQLYGASAAKIGLAVNACTVGMAIFGPVTAICAHGVPRRTGIWLSLGLLSVPTGLLAFAPSLTIFALLRILQGAFMAAAFTLTLAHLAERCTKSDTASALAAYVTGSVAANLVGRLIATIVTDHFGSSAAFLAFAGLNLAGAILSFLTLTYAVPMASRAMEPRFLEAMVLHLKNPSLLRTFGIGFLILFSFVSIFSYVGFVLVSPRVGLPMPAVALVFLCFLPSLVTTPPAGRIASRIGAGRAGSMALAIAIFGILLLLASHVMALVLGLALFAAGSFFAQAIATGHVGRTATFQRAAASGLYLSAYYCGGLVGAAVIGAIYERFGWTSVIAANLAALSIACWFMKSLAEPDPLR